MKVRLEYPKMLYAGGGILPRLCQDAGEEAKARAAGFGDYVCVVDMPVTPLERAVVSGAVDVPQPEPPTDAQWNDLKALMAYGRAIGMKLGPKYKLETLQDLVRQRLSGMGA